jgi:hypothetical protein
LTPLREAQPTNSSRIEKFNHEEHSAASRNQEKPFGQDEQDCQDKAFFFCHF